MEKGGLAFCEQECSYEHVWKQSPGVFFLHIVILTSMSINLLADNLNFYLPFLFWV